MDEQQVKLLLGNPYTLAIIISRFLELTDYFKDEAKPALAKIGIVTAACIIAAVAYTAMLPAGLDFTRQGLLSVGVLALAMTFSTQVFHLLIAKLSPLLADLFAQKTTSQISVTTGGTSATATTVQPSAQASAEPTLAAAANAVNVASPDAPPVPDAMTAKAVEDFLKANSLMLVPRLSPSSGYAPDSLRSTPRPDTMTPVSADDISAKG